MAESLFFGLVLCLKECRNGFGRRVSLAIHHFQALEILLQGVETIQVFGCENQHFAFPLKEEAEASKERLDYLQSINILLMQAIKDLKADLGKN